MTDERGDEMRVFLKSLLTVPNIMALLTGIVLIASWKQNQDAFREQTEQRIVRLETQLNQALAENTDNRVNRAVVSAQLAQIQLDITSMRIEVKDTRNEVRKIR
jgi:hypothetical protein